MLGKDKEKMITIIDNYRTNEDYRNYVNSKDLSELSELEQIALKDMLVVNNNTEIINSDFSNHYQDFNPVNVETDKDLQITCMNMAVAYLLHRAFQDNNIKKYSNFNLEDIKTRMKGDMFSTLDKPMIIKFIRFYNHNFPDFLPKKAKEFMHMYYGHIRNGFGSAEFISLANTFNTNIYLSELSEQTEDKGFFRKKR